MTIILDLLQPDFRREHNPGGVNPLLARVDSLPKGLYQLYSTVISSAQASDAELMLVLQWMLYSQRPLKLDELYLGILYGNEFTAAKVSDNRESVDRRKRSILIWSRRLIDFRRFPLIQFMHHSVEEFLRQFDSSTEDLWKNLEKGAGHQQLRICCTRQLTASGLMDDLADMAEISAGTNSIESLKRRDELKQKYPLLNYAADNFLYHAEQAQAAGVSQHDFLRFFGWSSWITVYNFVQVPERQLTLADIVADKVAYVLESLKLPHLENA